MSTEPPIQDTRSFLQVDARGGRVADIVFPLHPNADHASVPPVCTLADIVWDQDTATAFYTMASLYQRCLPMLLMAPTGFAKTTLVVALATLVQSPIITLTCGDQTQADDLVGRYAPKKDGFSFVRGPLLAMMERGGIFHLDEGMTAPPQALERLNSVLDYPNPSIVVHEHESERIEPARGFLAVVSGNPPGAAYPGRKLLGWALRDRLHPVWLVAPSESAILAMQRGLLFGESPSVVVAGRRWAATSAPVHPMYAWVEEVSGDVSQVLPMLARLHVVVAGMTMTEPTAVTRRRVRSLWMTLAHAAPRTAPEFRRCLFQAVHEEYVALFSHPSDRAASSKLIESVGLNGAWLKGKS